MRLIVSAWIPRSFLHIFEVNKSTEKFGLQIKNIEVGNKVSFDILRYKGHSKIGFELDGTGQYNITFKNSGDINSDINLAKEIILETIIKNSHSVTYKQIKDGTLPLMFSAAVISRTDIKPNLSSKKTGKLKIYYDLSRKFEGNSLIYIIGDRNADEAAKFFNFTACASSFLYKMMDMMADYYNKADRTADLLEESISLIELKKAVFGFDLTKKKVSESLSKIRQMNINMEGKREEYNSSRINSSLKKLLDLDGAFKRLESDRRYTESLWELLTSYLDNIDSAAEARLSFQESIESRKIEALLSIESASVVASLLMAIFITEFTGMGAAILFISFIVVWVIMYYIIIKVKAKRREIRPVKLSLSK